jgi:hypothetical protein
VLSDEQPTGTSRDNRDEQPARLFSAELNRAALDLDASD